MITFLLCGGTKTNKQSRTGERGGGYPTDRQDRKGGARLTPGVMLKFRGDGGKKSNSGSTTDINVFSSSLSLIDINCFDSIVLHHRAQSSSFLGDIRTFSPPTPPHTHLGPTSQNPEGSDRGRWLANPSIQRLSISFSSQREEHI